MTALTRNLNIDPKKTKPLGIMDFALFQAAKEDDKAFSAEVAAVALGLRHEDRCPPLLLSVWEHILSSATDARPPATRAFRSDDDSVWIIAPSWEGRNCRGGLVVVRNHGGGVVRLRDIDRPLITHDLTIPKRNGFGWLEAGLLLATGKLGV